MNKRPGGEGHSLRGLLSTAGGVAVHLIVPSRRPMAPAGLSIVSPSPAGLSSVRRAPVALFVLLGPLCPVRRPTRMDVSSAALPRACSVIHRPRGSFVNQPPHRAFLCTSGPWAFQLHHRPPLPLPGPPMPPAGLSSALPAPFAVFISRPQPAGVSCQSPSPQALFVCCRPPRAFCHPPDLRGFLLCRPPPRSFRDRAALGLSFAPLTPRAFFVLPWPPRGFPLSRPPPLPCVPPAQLSVFVSCPLLWAFLDISPAPRACPRVPPATRGCLMNLRPRRSVICSPGPHWSSSS